LPNPPPPRLKRLLRRGLVAAAAQYGVQRYLVGGLREADGDQPLLRRIEGALRVEDAEETVDSFA